MPKPKRKPVAKKRPVSPKPKPARPRSAATRKPGKKTFPIVGIGASAGGLEAMTRLLGSLPPSTGMAFVLVQHLDPTHESALATLLARATTMAVGEARHDVRLQPDTLYVIPPNTMLGLAGRRLKLAPRKPGKAPYNPIDHFLQALAAEGTAAIGIILSGAGSDGTNGLMAIKDAGGLTFAQDGKTAKYPLMPGNAEAAGCVDFVLPPEKIARELGRLAGQPVAAPPEPELESDTTAPGNPLQELLVILRQRMGVDFTHYKQATLRRRIQRRILLHKLHSPKEYAAFLRTHPAEIKELFTDILIHVTGFFRDPGVFQALKKRVFPRLIKNNPPRHPLRIWVPGCSTGEEVYSLAMALVEFLSDQKASFPVQIFGTDVNEKALEKARAGLYPENILTGVSPERLRRFFLKAEGGHRVNKCLRDMCIFARQNLAADPPFSNLDLVSCRNVLIYLGLSLQRRVLPLFHYSLRPGGFLMLGASETIGGFADLFALLDKKAKLYARKTTATRPAVSFTPAPVIEPYADQPTAPVVPGAGIGPALSDIQKHGDRLVLTQFSPAGVIINKDLEVLQFRGHTGLFLEHSHGEASLHLLKMVRDGLTFALRAALARAMKQNARAHEEIVPVRHDGHSFRVHIDIVPFQVPPSRERFYLVLFTASPLAVPEPPGRKLGPQPGRVKNADPAELNRLREELASTRESLQDVIEGQDASNEELRSANEEIMSSNEELQSTNEELETAKEELQSTNEELTTLNDELESRNGELEHVNNDLHNLLASVNIPIVMVEPDLRIRRFTSLAEKLLHLIPSDLGRPLTDINLKLDLPDLGKHVAEVIDTLQTREQEVKDRDGRWWSVRIRPYKTTDNKIDGAVVALLDVDLLKNFANQMRQGREFAEAIINTMREPLVVLDHKLVVQTVNEAFYRTFKVSPRSTLGRRIYELGDGQWDLPRLRELLEEILPHNASFADFEVEHDFPRIGRRKMLLNARRLDNAAGRTQMILLAIETMDPNRKNPAKPT